MMAIRRSVMSLYEVSDIVRGQSFLARDLIRGGEPVRVTEHTATKQMAPWDRIAARIVHLGRTYQMTGGALAYGLETSDKLFAELARLEDRLQRGIHDLAEEIGASLDRDRLADIVADGGSLEVAAHLFTRVWLADALDRALNRRLPKLVNAEGDAIVFCTLTFPLAGAAGPGQICSALDVVDDLRRAGDSSFYNWIGPENARGRPTEGIALNTMHSEGGHVLGGIEATESAVVVTTNSLQRNERVRIKLTEVLAGMVGEPTLDAKTPDEAMAKRERAPGANNSAQKLDLSPEEECRIVHSCLDDHYRKGLDRGVPMLGGMTPREAATTAAGRAKVAAWLKYLENQSRKRHEPGNPLASYDIGWLWIELGVTELRM
jgi:hypothetical protein